MMIDTSSSSPSNRTSAEKQRPRMAPRSLKEIYGLPAKALLTPAETSLVTRLTEPALGDLLTPPNEANEQ